LTKTDMTTPEAPTDLASALQNVFLTACADEKAEACLALYETYRSGDCFWQGANDVWPDRPARPNKPDLLAPRDMPRRRLTSADGLRAQLHALAHIELNAIDLAIDIIGRFYGPDLPQRFLDDWMRIAADEARHFLMLNKRLRSLESFYGDFPAHDGLWQAALDTADDLAARLSIVPLVLEARGLDVTPEMCRKFMNAGDTESARILQVILRDEKTHVATGMHWFLDYCEKNGENPTETFRFFVKTRFAGQLKAPFNIEARQESGMPDDFYLQFE
jgi:uncharacterized ferritin-like protein (DUF455 family)